MVGETEEEEIGTRALQGQGYLYTLMQTHKSWDNYSKMNFLTRLGKEWSNLCQKRPPFQASHVSGIPVPPHVSLQPEVLENDGWKEIIHPTVSQHHGCPKLALPAPPIVNQIFQAALVHLLVQFSHESKRLKTETQHAPDKGKVIDAPSSPSNDFTKSVSSHMHLRYDFPHVISEIRPKGSKQPKENSERLKGDNNNNGKIASQSGKYSF
jgi:hypothetical protein